MPALILETGAGTPGANTFVSESDVWDYLSGFPLFTSISDLFPNYDAATGDDTLRHYIVWAVDLIHLYGEWDGYLTHRDQPLPFPRAGLIDRNGYRLLPETVPPDVVKAQTSMIGHMILGVQRAVESEGDMLDWGAVKSFQDSVNDQLKTKVDQFSWHKDRTSVVQAAFSPEVRRLLEPYGTITLGVSSVRLIMG